MVSRVVCSLHGLSSGVLTCSHLREAVLRDPGAARRGRRARIDLFEDPSTAFTVLVCDECLAVAGLCADETYGAELLEKPDLASAIAPMCRERHRAHMQRVLRGCGPGFL